MNKYTRKYPTTYQEYSSDDLAKLDNNIGAYVSRRIFWTQIFPAALLIAAALCALMIK